MSHNADREASRSAWPLGQYLGEIFAIVIGLLVLIYFFSPVFSPFFPARRGRPLTKTRLKHIGLALHSYHDAHQKLPLGGTFDARERGYFGWHVALLPYLDNWGLFNEINFDVPWDDPKNAALFRLRLFAFQNPHIQQIEDAQGFSLSHHAANSQILGPNRSHRFEDISDGVSNTLFVGEITGEFLPYAQPGNWRDPANGINAGPHSFGSTFPDSANFLMGDGSVRWVSKDIDPTVLRALSTAEGGETIGDW
jgi:prepilin-type processing-associated H-X9-DG protein